MNAYYLQIADQITPIFGANSPEEAKSFTRDEDQRYIVETSDDVYMNIATGSLGFESEWSDLSEVVKVNYCADNEMWIEA